MTMLTVIRSTKPEARTAEEEEEEEKVETVG